MLKKISLFIFLGSIFIVVGTGCVLQKNRFSETGIITPVNDRDIQGVTNTTGLYIISKEVKEENKKLSYNIKAKIPQINGLDSKKNTIQEKINAELAKIVNGLIEQFKKEVGEWGGVPVELGQVNALDIDYQIFTLSPEVVSISFKTYQYMRGAAHPNFYFVTFNYDLNSEKRISLRDLFNKNVFYLTELSKITNTKLKEQGQDVLLQKRGEEYFEDFTLTQKELIILFDEGVVGPYVIGPIQVAIPWEQLSGILDPQGAGKLLE
jgi:hypothetical protein